MKKPHLTILFILSCFQAFFAQTIILDNQFAKAINRQCPTCIDYKNQLLIPAAFLRKLDVRASGIHNLKGIEGFVKLDTFDCSFNPLNTLPTNLPLGLTYLHCANDSLTQLPVYLPPLLKDMDCSFNSIEKLPALPFFMVKLRCMNNAIDSLPNQMPYLTQLNCSNNKLKDIDLSMSKKLVHFACGNNVLKRIKELPQTLEYLDCRFNELTHAPFLPYKTTYFNCSNNKISAFDGLSDSLRTFICDHNAITELPELPKVLTNLQCHNNQLFGIASLPNSLKSLDCRANLFTRVPKLPFNLRQLKCTENPSLECFTNIPDLLTSDTLLPVCPQTIYEKVEITESKMVKDRSINLIPYRKKEKWGYATFEGNVVIQPKFDSVQFFRTREDCKMPLAIVTVDSSKGLLDNTGDFVLKPEYSDIQCSKIWGFVALKDTGSNWIYLSNDGLWTEDTLHAIKVPKTPRGRNIGNAKMTEDEVAKNIRPTIYYQAHKASFSKRVKITESYWQMTDTIMPIKYDSLVFTSPYSDTLLAQTGKDWGVINTKQDTIVPFLYDNISNKIHRYRLRDSTLNKWMKYTLFMAHQKGMGWGIFSGRDSATVPFMFDSLDIAILPSFVKPSDTVTQQKILFKVKNDQDLWGIMDIHSKWLLFCQYTKIESDEQDGFRLFTNDKIGFYNPRTNFTIQPIYKDIHVMMRGVLEVVTMKDKIGYIDDFGNEYFEDEF